MTFFVGCTTEGDGAPASGSGSAGTGVDATAIDAASQESPGVRPGVRPGVGPGVGGVRSGLEVLLADSLHLVAGRRAGLVTNHTGFDGEGVSSIDRLHRHPQVELVALFSPEHGIRGTAEAGERVDHTRDEATGLPVHSLYGETRKPTPAMLEGVEVLLFDILDIGTRYYTYIYTLSLAQEAAGEAGIPFIVLDRPNVIGGVQVQGNVLDPAFASFVGLHPLPIRHGMTPGELARFYREVLGIEAELHVVPLEGWRREMHYSDTGLPWRPPSPNMPSEESALHYPGTCLFEGTNLSVGRGTDRAFQQVGAPWLDGGELARRMEARELPGVRFEAVRFTPVNPGDGKFAGEEVEGVRLHVTHREGYDPVAAGLALLVETRRMSAERWRWNASHFDRLAGTDRVRLGIEAEAEVETLREGWQEELASFRPLREGALIYR
jgi:uncharacterized protein YbbC (DUF1343 family)